MRPRSRATVLASGLGFLLLIAGAAAAADGGFSPVTPRTPNGNRINDAYWYIFGFAAFVFVVRFRSRGRGREIEGSQIRGNTNLELAWTAGPVLILAAIAAFVFYKLPGIKNTPPAKAGTSQLEVKVEGHQFYWQFDYPGGAVSIDRMVVPVNQVVKLTVVSADVAHSWWIPALGGKIDAIPGRVNHTWFSATETGTYTGTCAEFCGIQHANMKSAVEVVSEAEYRSFIAHHALASATLGGEIVAGVCAKCHGGLSGNGDIGPKIAGNALFNDKAGLTLLLREGRPPTRTPTGMPAVGKTWSAEELATAIKALQKRYGSGGSSGG